MSITSGTPPEPTRCMLCGQERRLILMESGARWWCDHDPTDDGIVVITRIEPDGRVRGRVLGGPELPAQGDAFVPHSKTCKASQERARLDYIRRPKCPVCKYPLHPLNVADGTTIHPNCAPSDPGEELAAVREQLREKRTA